MATIAANLVLGGNLLIYAGTIEGFDGSAGSISGAGTITIGALGASGLLTLKASDGASIVFQPNSVNGVPFAFETLQLDGPLPAGVIIGFVAGDAIVVDRTVTGVAFTQTTGNQGILTLTAGATTVGTLTLGGNYTTSLFQVDVAATTGVATISVEVAPSASGSAAASTGNHAYKLVRRQRWQLEGAEPSTGQTRPPPRRPRQCRAAWMRSPLPAAPAPANTPPSVATASPRA